MTQADSHIALSTLPRADGSATYTRNGYSVICGINGPLEVQRRDPLPEEAILEVNVRPSTGGGSVRDRHHETILHSALKSIILTSAYPRALIQITLQIISTPENELHINGPPQAASQIDILPSLLQAAVMALLSASIPLTSTLLSTLLIIDWEGNVIADPDAKALSEARSLHAFAFDAKGGCVVMESEGGFTLEEWEEVFERAREICLGDGSEGREEDGDVKMEEGGGQDGGLLGQLRKTVEQKVEQETRWKAEVT